MGIGGISVWQLLIVLVIVIVLFGTKRIRQLGGDLGGALSSFKRGIRDVSSLKHDVEQTGREIEDTYRSDDDEKTRLS